MIWFGAALTINYVVVKERKGGFGLAEDVKLITYFYHNAE